MTMNIQAHPDMATGSRKIRSYGLTDTSMIAAASTPDFSLFRATTNITETGLDTIRPVVIGGDVLIVTAIEDLMSVLCMVMTLRPGITYSERGSVRILVTEPDRPSSRVAHASTMSAARVKAYFLRPSGPHLSDPRDLRAVGAVEAISSGAIRIRILDHLKLVRTGKRAPGGVRASMIVGEDFAALSTAGFSRRDLLDRAVMVDRVASEGPAYAARREAAETFWSAGHPCGIEISEVLGAMVRPVEPADAVAEAVAAVTGFDLFAGGDAARHPIRNDLISQALARVYENGFAFVSVPAGAGQSEIQDEVAQRLAGNASRMIGGSAGQPWCANVETATGAIWTDKRIAAVLSEKAPLALDGAVAPAGNESELTAVYRRLKCRAAQVMGSGKAAGYAGFPEIRCESLPLVATKGQVSAFETVWSELEIALGATLDKASEREVRTLRRIAAQSAEAALLAWKQGGMNSRVRLMARDTGSDKQAPQNFLPMFPSGALDEAEASDLIGDALSSRAFRSLDKARVALLEEIASRKGQVLCLVEDDLARHALARRMVESGDMSVTAVVSEAALRAQGISGREVTYQRAETAEVAMTMLAGLKAQASVVFASAGQASEMSLPHAGAAVALSVPADKDKLAGGLSAIDGLGKVAGSVSCCVFAEELCVPESAAPGLALNSADLVSQAAAQMRLSSGDAHDGVADIIAELSRSLPAVDLSESAGNIDVAVVESENAFSIFVFKGTSSEADQAAMPPRILAVCRDPATGEEIVLRNQVGCAEFLASVDISVKGRDPRAAPVSPELKHLDVIGRQLSHLSHWDARPERLVCLLDGLAGFLGGDDAETLFSDLCLVSLELLAARWQDHLLASRRLGEVKEAGLAPAIDALRNRPVWEVDEVKADMIAMLDWRIVTDASRSKGLHDRLVAVIHGTGEAGLTD